MGRQEFEQRIGMIVAATTSKELKEAAAAALAAKGFERWLYASDNPYGVSGLPATLANEFGKWLLIYMTKGYQRVDPIVAHCRASSEPLLWDSTVGWEAAADEVRAFMGDVAANGFGSGAAIPLHVSGWPQGVLSVTSAVPLSNSLPHFEETLPCLLRVGHAMHGTMVNIMKKSSQSLF